MIAHSRCWHATAGVRRFVASLMLFAMLLSTPAVAQFRTLPNRDLRGAIQLVTSDADRALHFAPVLYQDTDSSCYAADYITRIDYDANWLTEDNWENLFRAPLAAHSYYSIVESTTHWFIVYGFYHPRDWNDSGFDQEHENDLEGLLIIARKDGTRFGKLEGAITVYHNDLYSYTPAGSPLRAGHEDIDGTLTISNFEGGQHPLVVQQAKGHGLKAWPYTGNFRGRLNEDGIIYYPSASIAEVPESGNDRCVRYKLIDVFAPRELWERQIVEARLPRSASQTFATWGKLKGNSGGGCGDGEIAGCKDDAACTPWGWDDHDDGATFRGELALDPAHVTDHYFNGLGSFSSMYIRNRYIADLRRAGYNRTELPRGWPLQLSIESLFNKLPNS